MYFGENKRLISQYEKSLSSFFILSRVFKEYSSSFGKFCVIISCCEDIYGRHCIQKSATITSTHNLPFLFSRINKLDRDFLYWQTLSLVCPWENHVTSLLSHQPLSAFKDGEYREWGLWATRHCAGQNLYLQNSPNSHNVDRQNTDHAQLPDGQYKAPIFIHFIHLYTLLLLLTSYIYI